MDLFDVSINWWAFFNTKPSRVSSYISSYNHLLGRSSSPLELERKCVVEFRVCVDVVNDEGGEELVEELPGDLLNCVTVDALLEEATLEDVAPPALHVGCHTLSEALLVSSFLELSLEDVDHIEAIRRDEIDFRVTELIADIYVMLLENGHSGLHASVSMLCNSILIQDSFK